VAIGRDPSVLTVTAAWVAACTKRGARVPFEAFRLPILQGCQISFTNVAKPRRVALQQHIEAAGGRVAADMNRCCNYLLVGDATQPSPKLKCAPGGLTAPRLRSTASAERAVSVQGGGGVAHHRGDRQVARGQPGPALHPAHRALPPVRA